MMHHQAQGEPPHPLKTPPTHRAPPPAGQRLPGEDEGPAKIHHAQAELPAPELPGPLAYGDDPVSSAVESALEAGEGGEAAAATTCGWVHGRPVGGWVGGRSGVGITSAGWCAGLLGSWAGRAELGGRPRCWMGLPGSRAAEGCRSRSAAARTAPRGGRGLSGCIS